MKNRDLQSQLNILAVGLTKESFILITRDFLVYDMPKSKYDVNGSVYLDSHPTPMKDKWPELFEDRDFLTIKHNIKFAFIMLEADTDYLCFLAPTYGLNFDLNSRKIIVGWVAPKLKQKHFLISTEIRNSYYFFLYSNDMWRIFLYELKDSAIKRSNLTSVICLDNSHQLHFGPKCPATANWSMLTGFVSSGKFHMFTPTSVLIFSEKGFYRHNETIEWSRMEYKHFFYCKTDLVIPSSSFSWSKQVGGVENKKHL